MPLTWLQIRVDLLGGRGIECDPPPGRVFLAGPGHTFANLAEAIEGAFGRWDAGHLHSFELADGRVLGPDPEDDEWLSEARVRLGDAVSPGEAFTYTFDLGDDWQHACTVLEELVDPLEAFDGRPPKLPVVADGWGWIPDQYGRRSFEDDGE